MDASADNSERIDSGNEVKQNPKRSKCGCYAALIAAVTPVLFLYWLFFHAYTVYSPGYSDWAFRKIHPGQSLDEVIALLGEPIRKIQPEVELWEYEGWQLHFDENGMAMSKWRHWPDEPEREYNLALAPPGTRDRVLKGLSREHALAIYGEPLKKTGDGEQTWMYSHPTQGGYATDLPWNRRELRVNVYSKRVLRVNRGYAGILGEMLASIFGDDE